MNRRITFIVSLAALAIFAYLARDRVITGSSTRSDDSASAGIIREGSVAPIYIPDHASKHEIEAAEELARVIGIMSGQQPLIATEPCSSLGRGIFIGHTQAARRALPDLFVRHDLDPSHQIPAPFDPPAPRAPSPLPPESWDNIGWAATGDSVIIAGRDPAATKLAVSRFLQEEGGVRWWIPGTIGEDVSAKSEWQVAQGVHYEKPSFYSRRLSVSGDEEHKRWFTHNLLADHVWMNHNLNILLTRDVASKHPEWFPLFQGKPFDTRRWKGQIPHPLYTNTEVADFVADKAIAYFSEHPDELTYSISPADNTLFGDLENYAGLVAPNAVFRAKSDLSNAVFTFDNRVARQVAAVYPDRYLGALAYAFWENVPDFPVEPNIIPILTADRSQWYDPEFRADDLALIRKWSKAGPRIIGTWDYFFGYPYLVPKVMLRAATESVPEIHEAGVRTYYAQMSPIWGFDAPKAWLTAQLLWDCNQDVEKLKTEFFDGYFGPTSALMRAFYEECDRIWMEQSGKAYWIKFYGNADQITLFPPEDILRLRSMIDAAQAIDLPPASKYRARVQLVSDAFTYTERLSKAWIAHQRVAEWTPGMPVDELVAALPDYLAGRADMAAINRGCTKDDNLNRLMTRLGYLEDDDPLEGRLALIWPNLDASERERISSLAPDYTQQIAPRTIPLFKSPFANGLDNWLVTHWPNPLLRFTLNGEGADRTLSVSHAHTFCLTMNAKVREGTTYGAAFGAAGTVTPGTTVRLLLKYLDKDGNMQAFHSDRLPCGELHHALVAVAGKAPEGTATANLTLTVYYQSPDDMVTLEPWQTK